MDLDQSKKYVAELLDTCEIKHVYYIDDYLSFDGLSAISKYIENNPVDTLKAAIPSLPDTIPQAKQANISDLTSYISSWWESLDNTRQEEIVEKCNLQLGSSETNLKTILGSRCSFCTPEQWNSGVSNKCLVQINKGEKVLILFDYKIDSTTEGEGRTGITLANTFKNNPNVIDNSFCGIFSNLFSIDNESSFRKQYKNDLSDWAFPLAKARLNDNNDFTSLTEGIKNILWVHDVCKLNKLSSDIIKSASEKMVNEFNDITPHDFKQLIINSSSKEGCREIDTLLRLIHIIFNKQILESLSTTPDRHEPILETINRIRDIDAITEQSINHKFEKRIAQKYFQDESFIPGNILNTLLTPLQNGDVFYIGQKHFYVLLCQPCNIAIRSDGKRQNDYDIGFFVPLHEIKTDNTIAKAIKSYKGSNNDNEALTEAESKIKRHFESQRYHSAITCSINNKMMYAAMNEYKTIRLSLLDYATLHEDGQVILHRQYSTHLHKNQQLLAGHNKEIFQEINDLDNLIDGLAEDCKVIIKPKIDTIHRLVYRLLFPFNQKIRFDNSQYIFPIQRFGHLQEPYSSDLLIQLSHYISRTGFPNSFDKE